MHKLQPYQGKWVALLGQKVIAQGGTPEQVIHSAAASRYKERVKIMYVPTQHDLNYPRVVRQLQEILKHNSDVYLVGGVIRDAILGRDSKDIDIVVSGNAIEIARQTANSLNAAFYPLKESFNAGRIICQEDNLERVIIDITGLRGSNIEEDLEARDFTINALAASLSKPDELLDPLGGISDLADRKIRACSQKSLESDPIRILRGVRQAAAFDFTIDPETRRLMRTAVNLLPDTSPERLRDELFLMLSGRRAFLAIKALDLLGALSFVLPEIETLKNIEQSPPHAQSVFPHTISVLNKLESLLDLLSPNLKETESGAAANLIDGLTVFKLGRYREQITNHLNQRINVERSVRSLLFFSTLYHDVGKLEVQTVDDQGRIRFFGHDEIGAKIVELRGKLLKLSKNELQKVYLTVRHHMRPIQLTNTKKPPSARAIYRFFNEVNSTGIDICLLSLADVLATYEPYPPQDLWAAHLDTIRSLLAGYWENQGVTLHPELLITGEDVMRIIGIDQGPAVGDLLNRLSEAQAIGIVKTRSDAENFVIQEYPVVRKKNVPGDI